MVHGMALNAEARLKEHNAGKKQVYQRTQAMEINLYRTAPSWPEARLSENILKYAGKIALKKI
jgi:predicted GIY-YIG superfamily endonuclease